jgi:DNA processing protein
MTADRLARARLTYLAEPADEALNALVAAVGAAQALEIIHHNDELASPVQTAAAAAVARAMPRWRQRLDGLPQEDDLREYARAGIRLICPGDPEWPSRLDELGEKAPYALWARGNGDLRFCCLRSVAMVGARAATSYGCYVASEMASSLAARGWAIVSGGAYGIDAAAHRGALAAAGATVAVLACGVDHPYPAGHVELMKAITADGVVVSEWPPGINATRLRFLNRNRVIAALAAGTIVVEAGRRSGALNTAKHARDLGRPLMAVPGPVTSEQSTGANMLLRDWKAAVVTGAADVAAYLGPLDPENPPDPVQPVLPWDELDSDLKEVLDALPARGGASTEQVATAAGVAIGTALRCLGALASGGFAQRCPEGWRIRRTHAAGDDR